MKYPSFALFALPLFLLAAPSRADDGAALPADAGYTGRENIEWIDIWLPHSTEHALPHVLLIGDSITRNYYPVVDKLLDKKAYVGRLTTSQFVSDPLLVGQITLILEHFKFDIIQFNNGMHGWPHTEAEYRAGFPAFLAAIRDHAHGAQLIWATTTPVGMTVKPPGHPDQNAPLTERVKARNAIALEFVSKAGIPVDDIFTTMLPHPEYHDAAGIHFTQQGEQIQGEQVAAEIEKYLPR
jgi:hypothetical protein